jgi:hypothetical protein
MAAPGRRRPFGPLPRVRHEADRGRPSPLVIEGWGSYVVEPVDAHTCRLLARSHAARDAGGLVYVLLIELPHAIMERRMLLGIKERAEGSTPPG